MRGRSLPAPCPSSAYEKKCSTMQVCENRLDTPHTTNCEWDAQATRMGWGTNLFSSTMPVRTKVEEKPVQRDGKHTLPLPHFSRTCSRFGAKWERGSEKEGSKR